MSCLTRYMIKSTQKLGEYVKQVVRYAWGRSLLLESLNLGLMCSRVEGHESTSCHYIMYNNALVHWRSKVASILATFTTEAELISAASCFQDVAFCRKLAIELGFMQAKSTVLCEDNNGCSMRLARTGHYRGRSKHFALRCDMLRPRTNWRTLERNPAHALSFSE